MTRYGPVLVKSHVALWPGASVSTFRTLFSKNAQNFTETSLFSRKRRWATTSQLTKRQFHVVSFILFYFYRFGWFDPFQLLVLALICFV
jgi:hypothetical protein